MFSAMISKIILTAVVIAGLVLYLRYNAARQGDRREAVVPGPGAEDGSRLPSPRLLATILVAFMILVSCAALLLEWRDASERVTVHVINTSSGVRVSYEARRGDIEDGAFTTVDGLRITPAKVERMEIEPVH